MFKISSRTKNGGIWDGTRMVKVLETDSAAIAEQFEAQGCTVTEVGESLEKRNAAQLKKYAKENGIDLGDAATKADILAIIEKTFSA